MRNNVPYFDSVYDWVNSLPYGKPLTEHNGRDCGGYVYGNPFNARYGERPTDVYNRLFCRDHYYNLTDEELTKLRTTIQYLPIYLDTALDNNIKFLESCGFKVYRKEGKPGDLKHVYLKRNNVSLYISNQTTPQDYRPNKINLSVGELIKKPNWKHPRRVEINLGCYDYGFDMPDEFGELTKKELEKYIKERMVEINAEKPVFKERSKLTFGDLHKFSVSERPPFKKLTIPVYVVNTKSGTLSTIDRPTFIPKENLGSGLSRCICGVYCGVKYSFGFYITKEQEKDSTARQVKFPTVELQDDNEDKLLYSDYVLCLEKEDAKKLAIKTINEKIKVENDKIKEIKNL